MTSDWAGVGLLVTCKSSVAVFVVTLPDWRVPSEELDDTGWYTAPVGRYV